MHRAVNCFKDMMREARKTKKTLAQVSDSLWKSMIDYWDSEEFKKEFE